MRKYTASLMMVLAVSILTAEAQFQVTTDQVRSQSVAQGVTQFQIAGTTWTNALPLSAMNLVTGDPSNSLKGGSNPAAADDIYFLNDDGTRLQIFWYCNVAGYEGWYDGNFKRADSVLVPTNRTFYIAKHSTGAIAWILPRPGIVRVLNNQDAGPLIPTFTPSSNSPGCPGMITSDGAYLYVYGPDRWKRIPLQDY